MAGAACAAAAFVSAARWPPGHGRSATVQAAASRDAGSTAPAKTEDGADYAQYDWQRVAESAAKGQRSPDKGAGKTEAIGLDQVPDLPDLPDFDDEKVPTESQPQVGMLNARVRVREVSLPDLPGGDDLVPPEPNPITDGGLGLFEWTGIWIVGLAVIGAGGYAGSYALARLSLDPELADNLLLFCKVFFGFFQFLLLSRVVLTQFPRTKTTDMPWAPIHYSTEWVLAPTRGIFPPEAGVDVAPIFWLIIVLLLTELLTGPSGVLTLVKNQDPLPPALSGGLGVR